MLSLTFEGKKYFRYTDKWINDDDMVVCLDLQDKLNRRYAEIVDLSSVDVETLISEADKFKKSESFTIAIKYYEEAVQKSDGRTIASIFPRLSSCYRSCGQARKAVDMLSEAKKKHGKEIIKPELLTSAAAAYCDLEEYDNAKKCADRARLMMGGQSNDYLRAVYRRIKSERNKKEP